MSSIVIDGDFASQSAKNLVVYITKNGRSLEFDCDWSILIEAVQRSIESAAEIPIANQLLICLHMKLEPHRPLLFYKLPSFNDDRGVFLYNLPRRPGGLTSLAHPNLPRRPPQLRTCTRSTTRPTRLSRRCLSMSASSDTTSSRGTPSMGTPRSSSKRARGC
ncbi:hypothetical protein QJS10_CPB14g01074 [Acorus calamus]|uniref:Uncharacterized protein n=1 Tax=Acorus calamus TaxID=4465 RepID=A0AAV9DB53_ACOCL|nr:hypothetical protein QJS10_CPB14g01074 [Acorus calamus]